MIILYRASQQCSSLPLYLIQVWHILSLGWLKSTLFRISAEKDGKYRNYRNFFLDNLDSATITVFQDYLSTKCLVYVQRVLTIVLPSGLSAACPRWWWARARRTPASSPPTSRASTHCRSSRATDTTTSLTVRTCPHPMLSDYRRLYKRHLLPTTLKDS